MSTKEVENHRLTKKLRAALTEPVLQPPDRIWKAVEREVDGTKFSTPKAFVWKWSVTKFFHMLPLLYFEKKIFAGTMAATVILALMYFQSTPVERAANNQVAWPADSLLENVSSINMKNASVSEVGYKNILTGSYRQDPATTYFRDKRFVTKSASRDFEFPVLGSYPIKIENPHNRQRLSRSGNRERHSGRSVHRGNSGELRKVSYRSSR